MTLHDLITLMILPIGTSGTNEIQYIKYTSEYIPKLQIDQHLIIFEWKWLEKNIDLIIVIYNWLNEISNFYIFIKNWRATTLYKGNPTCKNV